MQSKFIVLEHKQFRESQLLIGAFSLASFVYSLQSMDRAHRIGQKRNVNVYRLVTADSIEEKIMKLHEAKLAMTDAIVNTDNSKMFSMGTDRLLDIFRFRSENAQNSKSSQKLSNTLDTLVELYEDEYQDLSEFDFLLGFGGTEAETGGEAIISKKLQNS